VKNGLEIVRNDDNGGGGDDDDDKFEKGTFL
jgi:hypothetical protein